MKKGISIILIQMMMFMFLIGPKVHATDFELDDVGKVLLDFKNTDSYDIYSNLGTMNVVEDSITPSSNKTEIKTIFKDFDSNEIDLNITIKANSPGGSINAGVYVLAGNTQNGPDRIDALNVQVEKLQNQNAQINLFKFSSTSGYVGRLETGNEPFELYEDEVNLRVLIKGNKLNVFVQLSKTPILSYDLPNHSFIHGGIGLRSQFTDALFSDLEVMKQGEAKLFDKLEEVLLEANSLDQELYTSDSKEVFTNAIIEAEAVLNLEDEVTQYQIDDARNNLVIALRQLVLRPTFDSLTELISEAESIDKNKYNEASLLLLGNSIVAAKTITSNSSQDEIEEAELNLKDAIDNLIYKHYLKMFAVVSSFGVDSLTYLHQFAENAGVYLDIHYLYLGGGTLEQHSNGIKNNSKIYLHHQNGKVIADQVSVQDVIGLETWDYIVFQQGAAVNGLEDTYFPYVYEIMNYFSEKSPQAELIINQLWAYKSTSTEPAFLNFYNGSVDYMWNAIKGTLDSVGTKTGIRYVTPLGEAFQMARELTIEGSKENLYRDGFHANEAGRYLLAATWFQFITGLDVRDNEFISSGSSYGDTKAPIIDDMRRLREVAYDANLDYETMDLYKDESNNTSKEVVGIEITNNPNKTNYLVGQYLNLTGLMVKVIYSDNSKETINSYSINLIESLKETDNELIISFEGFESSINIKVTVNEDETETLPSKPDDKNKKSNNIFLIANIASLVLISTIGIALILKKLVFNKK